MKQMYVLVLPIRKVPENAVAVHIIFICYTWKGITGYCNILQVVLDLQPQWSQQFLFLNKAAVK